MKVEKKQERRVEEPQSQLAQDMAALGIQPTKQISHPSLKMSKTGSSVAASIPSVPISRTSSTPSIKRKKLDLKEEYAKRAQGKEVLNLVVVGHVDAGKSTLMGHLLYKLDDSLSKTLRKYEKEAERIKKGSFVFAWMLDETEEERNRGVTIDVAQSGFETEKRRYVVLDAPGHRDFVPNMISGTSQADIALLVVDAKDFESGFEQGGQTKEHALLVRSLGVGRVVVVVNKMDSIDWKQERYKEIKDKIGTFLGGQVGFKKESVSWIPVSGYQGENLIERKEIGWYNGPCLVELLGKCISVCIKGANSKDKFDVPKRPIDGPFRMCIADCFKGGMSGSSTVTVSGRIESGGVQIGDSVLIMPSNLVASVKSMDMNSDLVRWGVAGDTCMVTLTGVDISAVGSGFILCDPERPVPVTTHFQARIVTFDLTIPLIPGVPVVFHHQSLTEPGTICKLDALLDRTTGEVIKKKPRVLTKNVAALVEIKVDRPVCVELFRDVKGLGRFTLRNESMTVAAGIVTEILVYEKGRIVEEMKE